MNLLEHLWAKIGTNNESLRSTVNNVEYKHANFLVVDPNDAIVGNLASGTSATVLPDYSALHEYSPAVPVIIRGMTQRKVINACVDQGRDFYYIDTGYIGNLTKHKRWHRIVKNGMQHSLPMYDLPSDRFNQMVDQIPYDCVKFSGWKKDGSAILLVTPSEKPCKYYGIDREKWVTDTIAEIKKHSDRNIIVRDKALRRGDRVNSNSIYAQLKEDDIYAVVTYNSIAATEAIGYGIPAFALAPTIADPLCYSDLSKLEDPMYADAEHVEQWQNWIGYCQYTVPEMVDGTAIQLIKDYNLK